MASPLWEANKVFLSEGLKGIGSRGCTMVLQKGLLFLPRDHPGTTLTFGRLHKSSDLNIMLETELLMKGKG